MTRARVVLHVGTPKTGTTYLQDLLWSNRDTLAGAGIQYPGDAPDAHFLATLDLSYGNFHGWRDPALAGAWNRLVEAARQHSGTTVISHELLGDLTPEQIAGVLSDLDFAEVHVVVTARDLGRQLPAVWQEDLKNRHFLPFEDLLALTRPDSSRPDVQRPGPGRPEGHGETFWLRQDVPAVLRRWGADLPGDQVHLVTLPPAGGRPTVLWERFAEVLGVDPAIATARPRRRNTSLGHIEAELLRQLNERLDYTVDWPLYQATITDHLAGTVLADRPDVLPLALPPAERGWVAARSAAMVAELSHVDLRLIGDLDDLLVLPDPDTEPAAHPASALLLDAALDALAALLQACPPATGHADAPPAGTAGVSPATVELPPEAVALSPVESVPAERAVIRPRRRPWPVWRRAVPAPRVSRLPAASTDHRVDVGPACH